jgi:RHS repeat-associated protein
VGVTGQAWPKFANTYDNNGNLRTATLGTNLTDYAWDLDNRLKQLTQPGGIVHTYSYDANGLRVRQQTPQGTSQYLLDGPTILEELDGNAVTRTSYLANPQVIDEVLAFTTAGAGYWPLTDALGSVVAVTDAAGAVVRNNSYDVYGERTASTGTGPALAFGFTGREHDASGLNYNRDRYLDTKLGRWNQPDRLPFPFPTYPTAYGYAGSSPVSSVDPTGFVANTSMWLLLLNPLVNGLLSALTVVVYGSLTRQPVGLIASLAAVAFAYGFISNLPFGGVTASIVASAVSAFATEVLGQAITGAFEHCGPRRISWTAVFVGVLVAVIAQAQALMLLDLANPTPATGTLVVAAAVANAWVVFLFAGSARVLEAAVEGERL